MTVRIISNTTWFDRTTIGGTPVEAVNTEVVGLGRALRMARGADAIVINEAHRHLLAFCLLQRLTGKPSCIVAVDQILQPPTSLKARLQIVIWRWLLKNVRQFVFHYRDTDDVADLYRIPRDRVAYVPFKVNQLESILNFPARDEGYVLACGRSRRDYVSFCSAVADLPIQAVILAPIGEETKEHGTVSELKTVPPNVRLVHDDGSWESWLRWIGGAKLVVIPILPPTLAASGIGTYLVAMALGKCVVITDSLASRRILSDREAIIVPPLDAAALRKGIQSAIENDQFRETVAEGGKAYALSLGDETRLASDIVGIVSRLVGPDPTRKLAIAID